MCAAPSLALLPAPASAFAPSFLLLLLRSVAEGQEEAAGEEAALGGEGGEEVVALKS